VISQQRGRRRRAGYADGHADGHRQHRYDHRRSTCSAVGIAPFLFLKLCLYFLSYADDIFFPFFKLMLIFSIIIC
jgi:hypothetical protein